MRKIITTGIAAVLLLSAGFVGAEEIAISRVKGLDFLINEAKNRAEQSARKIKQLRLETQEQIKQKQENLRSKVAEIKDEKKQKAAEKILNQFDHINRVSTDHFLSVLDKLDAVLQKIKSRAEKAASDGKDLTAAKQAIQKAEQSIKIAREAVIAQAAKTYTVDSSVIAGAVADEGKNSIVSKLRERFKELRKQLFNDLAALRGGAMKSAREAVHAAAEALAKVPNIDKDPTPSPINQ